MATLRRRKDGEISALRQRITRSEDQSIRQARDFDREKIRGAEQQEKLSRKLQESARRQALNTARQESKKAELVQTISKLKAQLAWQTKLSFDPGRCVSVAFDKTPLRDALADLNHQSRIRHVVSREALRGASQQTVSFTKAHVPLKEVLDEVARQTQLSWGSKEGAIHLQGLLRTDSGLRYQDLVRGKGPLPKPNQTLLVHYVGSFESGEVFDHSKGKPPLEFTLGKSQVIKGFEEGIASMRVGGKRRLVIPPALAYGVKGKGPVPPNSTLIFEVELISAK
ncbi:MAG: FKBP-type peptidyl-prolyl cis-trans isomerase [Planctomycetes bacterium]|nr:FKBP-type peptidyl-prolyl cis-trans isomerase [Planctomycetota bacterium]